MSAAVVLLLIVILLLIIEIVYVKKFKYKVLNNIPGPPTNIIWGNLFDFNKSIDELFESFVSLNKTYGRIVKIWPHPLRPLVVTSHPKVIERILSSNSHLSRSSFYENMKPFLGNSLVTSCVDIWKRNRKLINPAFQPKIFEDFITAFEFHGNKLINKLKKQESQRIDIPPFVDLYVLDVICETMTNVRTNYQETSDNGYLEARSTYLTIFMNRAYSFLKRPDLLFSLTNEFKIHKECLVTLRKFSNHILNVRKTARQAENCSNNESNISKTMLDLLIDSGVKDNDLIDHINTFIVAGHDTPGSTIAFALYEMAYNPNIQRRVLEESIAILGKDPNEVITVQSMQEMVYLDCVIKETLRQHTTIPAQERLLEEDITIDNITIPKGTEVSIAIFALHHDEEYFPNPRVFNPDRFLPENVQAIKPYTFIPFSRGPRDCIGKTMAVLLMKSVLAKIIRNFELLPDNSGHKVQLTSEFVLKSANGLPVILKSRNLSSAL